MTEERIDILADKWLKGTISVFERQELEAWYTSYESLEQEVNSNLDEETFGNTLFNLIATRAGIETANTIDNIKPAKREIKLWKRIAGAVAAATAITLGVWLYYSSGLFGDRPDSTLLSRVSRDLNDIGPGKNTATLTLANGKTIALSDAKTGIVISNDLRYNDGTEVALLSPSGRTEPFASSTRQKDNKNSELNGVAREGNNNSNPLSPQGGSLPEGERGRVQMLTASTPRGGTYQITLPDGTHVWLNADSKISFPSQFDGKARRVLLSGEAYFEVAKLTVTKNRIAKRMPFVVVADKQQVKVLGTHFNMNTYADEPLTKTTLLEGSVEVSILISKESVILKPRQQAILNKNDKSKIRVENVDATEAVLWKSGKFSFNSENLESIMRQVSRWYNVEVVFKDPVQEIKVTGSVSRFANISKLLEKLEQTGLVHFQIEGKKLIVMK